MAAGIIAAQGPIFAFTDLGTEDGDMTCTTWWKRHADGTLEVIDHRFYLPSRTHDDDLLGETTMSPAGFPFFPGMAGLFLRQPELDYARSPAQFGDAFGPTARTGIAQERMNARLDRKRIRQQRYRRLMGRRAAH